jgi:hypothetical protein
VPLVLTDAGEPLVDIRLLEAAELVPAAVIAEVLLAVPVLAELVLDAGVPLTLVPLVLP